jgi:hypothetical protein
MKQAILTLALALVAMLSASSPASAAFGLKNLDVTFTDKDEVPSMQAGSHPDDFTTTIDLETAPSDVGFPLPQGSAKDLRIFAPPGLVGNPTAVPYCSTAQFLSIKNNKGKCPDSSVLGITTTTVLEPVKEGEFISPVYNLPPPPGVAAQIGFWTLVVPTTVDLIVNPDPPYNVIARVNNIPQVVPFYTSKTTLWGNPSSPIHDSERGIVCANLDPSDSCPINIPEKPFLTLPASCPGPLQTHFEAGSWEGAFDEQTIFTHDNSEPPTPLGTTGCGKLGFAPQVSGQPTSSSAESPAGLDFKLAFDDQGLTSPNGISQATIQKAVVAMPQGVTLNPSVAEGLATCSQAELGRETATSEPGEGCPQASKVGEAEVETPLLEGKLLHANVYVAAQDDNTLNTRFAIYMVIKDAQLGILVKLAGKIEPDERSGQILTTFDGIPQFPFSEFRFHFREGARSPLVTPPTCGRYETKVELTPSSGAPPVIVPAPFQITSGVNGGPCPPAGVPSFKPGFEAGALNNNAATYASFYMRLTRQDGEQDMTRFDSVLPPGVVGKIAGVARCSDASLAAAKTKSGREELASPSCPASSQIGRVLVGAGVGGVLTWVPGRIYLAGPFGGDPLSVAVITPAVAGPFDVGTVVTREALTLDPNSAEVQVNGAASDPIPHILEGIPLKLRDLRVYVDRDRFILNPTSCDPMATRATLFGGFADVFSADDDVPVSLDSRFQAANCSDLGLKPKLALKLKGGTKRGAYPAFTATLKARPGDANIAKAVVTLPHSTFLEQAHIRTVCTRVQFAVKACPKGSIYGKATAFTPLLDEPLEGPVYLRSSSNPLPDLVAALHGIVDVNLVGRVDSVNARIRGSFENVPDAPVTKFILSMRGGKKGLIVNSSNLCAHENRAKARLTGQNGRVYEFSPALAPDCRKKVRQAGGKGR